MPGVILCLLAATFLSHAQALPLSFGRLILGTYSIVVFQLPMMVLQLKKQIIRSRNWESWRHRLQGRCDPGIQVMSSHWSLSPSQLCFLIYCFILRHVLP